MVDDRQFSMGVTDRQLGWQSLVRPWADFEKECVHDIKHEYQLGTVVELHKEVLEKRFAERKQPFEEGYHKIKNALPRGDSVHDEASAEEIQALEELASQYGAETLYCIYLEQIKQQGLMEEYWRQWKEL